MQDCIQRGTVISIEDLRDELGEFDEWCELKRYKIYEQFQKGSRTYKLLNLTAEIEDEYAFFDDYKGVIRQDSVRVLNGFLTTSVIDILRFWDEDHNVYKALIRFKDGTIKIDKIN